jgi:hypothetical protein
MPHVVWLRTVTVRSLILAGLALTFLSIAAGQDRTIVRGMTVERSSGQPIPGVNVILRGEKKGTVTDSTGAFRLELPSNQARIMVFSHIAYRKETRLEIRATTPSFGVIATEDEVSAAQAGTNRL